MTVVIGDNYTAVRTTNMVVEMKPLFDSTVSQMTKEDACFTFILASMCNLKFCSTQQVYLQHTNGVGFCLAELFITHDYHEFVCLCIFVT